MDGIAKNAMVEAQSTWLSQPATFMKRIVLSYRWLALIIILFIWQVVAILVDIGLLPAPGQVIVAGWGLLTSGLFFKELAASMVRILLGFGAAMVVGIIAGVLMGARRFWDEFFEIPVIVGLSLPGLIYAMMSVMIFGLGLTTPVIAILLAAYPFVAVNIREGVKATDKELVDMARVYLVDRWRMVTRVILPGLLPFILAAIRVGFTIAWKVSVLTEVFGASTGIGYQLRFNFQLFSMRTMIAWALLFGAVMLVIEYGLLAPAEKHFARWRPKVKEVI
jgi:NitT/TauT family transport system permease protein